MSQAARSSQEKQKDDGNQRSSSLASFFSLPPPLKALFDHFPLQTLPPNPLPLHSDANDGHVLWTFTTPEAAAHGAPSFNPGCLKWQTYLILKGVEFSTRPSNNHASLSGALPFLLPASRPSDGASEQGLPVPSSQLLEWTEKAIPHSREKSDMRKEALIALIDHRMRDAWLYNLYLSPENFDAVAYPLYIASATNSHMVRVSLARTLRQAARAELVKSGQPIDPAALIAGARTALATLATLLGEDEYFFGAERPGLFDASVFAYTHLLLDEDMNWVDTALSNEVKEVASLVRHRKRIYQRCYQRA